MRWIFLILIATRCSAQLLTPSLNWQQRSDWINVKTNVPNAIGNGISDDTLAIQTVLSAAVVGKTVYIPAGTYKITQTLSMTNNTAVAVIGNGRDTKIVWGGLPGGVMFSSNGNPYSRYIGLSWDGQNGAAVGFDHSAKSTFETEIQHINEAYRNFTSCGIRIGSNQVQASAEILYRNCLFTNCSIGIALTAFNDYDNTIDRCEFENCGTGILCNHGNFYARNSHFVGNNLDFNINSEHGSSIRHCTSQGANQFISNGSLVAPLTVQDCQVANWKASDTAVHLSSAPVLMFDCGFVGGPPSSFPVKGFFSPQKIIISSNSPLSSATLVSGIPAQQIYTITNGSLSGSLSNATAVFLQQTQTVPQQTFDAKLNFGAKGDGVTDDTTAIQNTINAAKVAANGALAYIPQGSYVVSQSLVVTGANYSVGGCGRKTCLNWSGGAGLPFLLVSNVQNVTVSDMGVGTHDCSVGNNGDDVLITGTGSTPCTLTVDGVYVYGKYDLQPNLHGLHVENLPASSVIQVNAMEGNVWITNCVTSSLLFRVSYEGTLTMHGPSSTNNIAAFQTRLGTITNPALQVFDDQSVTMTDFYVEQSQQISTISGSGGQNPGRVTIQCPKNDSTNNLVMNISGYAGQIYYGQVQFYTQFTSNTLFQSTSSPSLQLSLVGDYWDGNSNVFNLSSGTPMTMANSGTVNPPADSGITTSSMSGIGYALDDLRSVGALDLSLQPYVYPLTGVRISGTVTITGSGVFQ